MKLLISNRIIYVVFLFFMQTNLIYAMEENAQIKTLFEAADVNATFILYDLQKDTIVGYDKVRSEKGISLHRLSKLLILSLAWQQVPLKR